MPRATSQSLGVVDASTVAAGERQRIATELGYSETISSILPDPGSTTAHAAHLHPGQRLPFAGTRRWARGWWLRERGTPVHTLQVPAGIVQLGHDGELTTIRARAEWSPEFAIHDLPSADDVLAADPGDYARRRAEHYLWAWVDREQGHIRSRMFANDLGVPEDEATGRRRCASPTTSAATSPSPRA